MPFVCSVHTTPVTCISRNSCQFLTLIQNNYTLLKNSICQSRYALNSLFFAWFLFFVFTCFFLVSFASASPPQFHSWCLKRKVYLKSFAASRLWNFLHIAWPHKKLFFISYFYWQWKSSSLGFFFAFLIFHHCLSVYLVWAYFNLSFH